MIGNKLAHYEITSHIGARVRASLNHPHISAIHGSEESDGRKFLVMELATGRTLLWDRNTTSSRRPLPDQQGKGWMMALAKVGD